MQAQRVIFRIVRWARFIQRQAITQTILEVREVKTDEESRPYRSTAE
jgi:hypothetical protein